MTVCALLNKTILFSHQFGQQGKARVHDLGNCTMDYCANATTFAKIKLSVQKVSVCLSTEACPELGISLVVIVPLYVPDLSQSVQCARTNPRLFNEVHDPCAKHTASDFFCWIGTAFCTSVKGPTPKYRQFSVNCKVTKSENFLIWNTNCFFFFSYGADLRIVTNVTTAEDVVWRKFTCAHHTSTNVQIAKHKTEIMCTGQTDWETTKQCHLFFFDWSEVLWGFVSVSQNSWILVCLHPVRVHLCFRVVFLENRTSQWILCLEKFGSLSAFSTVNSLLTESRLKTYTPLLQTERPWETACGVKPWCSVDQPCQPLSADHFYPASGQNSFHTDSGYHRWTLFLHSLRFTFTRPYRAEIFAIVTLCLQARKPNLYTYTRCTPAVVGFVLAAMHLLIAGLCVGQRALLSCEGN